MIQSIFFVAFINPDKSVTLHVNRLGEAYIELIILSIVSILGFLSLDSSIRSWFFLQNRREKDRL